MNVNNGPGLKNLICIKGGGKKGKLRCQDQGEELRSRQSSREWGRALR